MQGSRQSSFFASSGLLPCMYPWQKLSKDHRWTNDNSNGQLIDIVGACHGVGAIDRTIAADVMHGSLAMEREASE